ncbi:MAG: hypothetical protein K8F25_10495, partial [Fimbriimonadaceae bacterium]|nr:hypothetical protein [Alphaproteobacteria bacterium]
NSSKTHDQSGPQTTPHCVYPWVFLMARRPIIKGLDDKAMAISGQQDFIVHLAAGHLLIAACSGPCLHSVQSLRWPWKMMR